jgi:uncharacterized oligopeptide transporter (OPT) family protein
MEAGAEAEVAMTSSTPSERPSAGFLPRIGSVKYHLLLSFMALFVLGPLAGLASTYMNLSLGFFVGGQVLAGILGSAVTFGYGVEGKHGANYMQTMAASVAAMSAMGVLIQAMVWLGMELPPAWQLMVFFGCVGMLGVGVGMLYTPILVDRLQLTFPSGLAVANILRALTDARLLKRSIGQLGGGVGLGVLGAWLVEKVALIGATGLSVSTLGAGIVVASRIGVPALVMAGIGELWTPTLRAWGWLAEGAPFRKVGFLMGLAMILGAAVVDISIIAFQTVKRVQEVRSGAVAAPLDRQRPLNLKRLGAWVLFWAVATVLVGHYVLNQPLFFLSFGVVLSLIFVLVNGISLGVSDSNPISSAFVISVLLMSVLGLRDPVTGMIAASILLVATSVGCDMQQDRSTGARLGSDRDMQFRYQTVGVTMGAVLAVGFVMLFMKAFPVLEVNTFANPSQAVDQWQSAMTYKFVGAIGDLDHLEDYKLLILKLGILFGIITEGARKLLHRSQGYRRYIQSSRRGFAVGWLMDAILLSSPYALSFGGFVEFKTALWFAAGGCLTSLINTFVKRKEEDADLPEDMSTLSLVGGGLIAGEALYALALGIIGLYALAR